MNGNTPLRQSLDNGHSHGQYHGSQKPHLGKTTERGLKVQTNEWMDCASSTNDAAKTHELSLHQAQSLAEVLLLT